ncbi:unnamed protein product, partial [Prorocentrum cordatum]
AVARPRRSQAYQRVVEESMRKVRDLGSPARRPSELARKRANNKQETESVPRLSRRLRKYVAFKERVQLAKKEKKRKQTALEEEQVTSLVKASMPRALARKLFEAKKRTQQGVPTIVHGLAFKKDFGIGQSRVVEYGVEVENRFEQLGQGVGDESMDEQERYDDDQQQEEKEQEANEDSTEHTQQGFGAGGCALLRALEKYDADGNGCVAVAGLRIMFEECDFGVQGEKTAELNVDQKAGGPAELEDLPHIPAVPTLVSEGIGDGELLKLAVEKFGLNWEEVGYAYQQGRLRE